MREYSFARLIPIIPTPSPKAAQQQQHKIVGTRTLNLDFWILIEYKYFHTHLRINRMKAVSMGTL